MKIEKKVNDQGRIEIKITEMIDWPESTTFEGPNFRRSVNSMGSIMWLNINEVKIGDHVAVNNQDDEIKLLNSLNKTSHAVDIANAIIGLHQSVMSTYAEFIEQNTESVEIVNADNVIHRLRQTDIDLYYTNKSGNVVKLDI